MRTITLTPEHTRFAFEHAEEIKKSKSFTKSWSTDNIALGLLGETAYSLMTGKPINTEVWRDRSDGGQDFDDGTDVKTISYMGPDPELKMKRLPVQSKTKKLVLAICDYKKDPNTVNMIGEISFENFKNKCKLQTYGENSWYAVGISDLDKTY